MLGRMTKSSKKKHDAGPTKRDHTRDTRAKMETMLDDDPKITPKELASALGVSVSRVHQLGELLLRRWVVKGRWGKV